MAESSQKRIENTSKLKKFPKDNFDFDKNGRKFSKTIENTSKLKEFPKDNFDFDKNGRKFSKRIENTVEKREIARYEQFLIFPQRFQKTCTADT